MGSSRGVSAAARSLYNGSMQSITVDLGDRSYPIYIGSGLLGSDFDFCRHVHGPDCLVVTNETVAPLYLDALVEGLRDKQVSVLALPDGEQYKTLATVEDILDTLVERSVRFALADL